MIDWKKQNPVVYGSHFEKNLELCIVSEYKEWLSKYYIDALHNIQEFELNKVYSDDIVGVEFYVRNSFNPGEKLPEAIHKRWFDWETTEIKNIAISLSNPKTLK